jgi:hypothetical protein
MGIQNEKKAELARGKKKEPNPYGANPLYINGVEHEIDMLSGAG